jgi:aminoglycoside phosphotransferase (APT) family kinase protein
MHISSLRKFIAAIPDIIPKDPDLSSPRFWHPDFHAGNIYVDENGKISSIIDWQGA